MARKLRPQIEGGFYHLTSRGNRKADIYGDDADRKHFLQLLTNMVGRYEWLVHTYCLMTNHYHLVVETPQPNISAGMQRLNSLHAMWFNWRYALTGHLFQGRFHSVVVENNEHLVELSRYVVLNPVRAGICAHPDEFRWSSYHAMKGMVPRPSFLTLDTVLGQFATSAAVARRRYGAFVEAGIEEASIPATSRV